MVVLAPPHASALSLSAGVNLSPLPSVDVKVSLPDPLNPQPAGSASADTTAKAKPTGLTPSSSPSPTSNTTLVTNNNPAPSATSSGSAPTATLAAPNSVSTIADGAMHAAVDHSGSNSSPAKHSSANYSATPVSSFIPNIGLGVNGSHLLTIGILIVASTLAVAMAALTAKKLKLSRSPQI